MKVTSSVFALFMVFLLGFKMKPEFNVFRLHFGVNTILKPSHTIKGMAQDDYIRTALRVPPELHKEIHAAAEKAGRSFNAEIISRLQSGDGFSAKLEQIKEVALLEGRLYAVRDSFAVLAREANSQVAAVTRNQAELLRLFSQLADAFDEVAAIVQKFFDGDVRDLQGEEAALRNLKQVRDGLEQGADRCADIELRPLAEAIRERAIEDPTPRLGHLDQRIDALVLVGNLGTDKPSHMEGVLRAGVAIPPQPVRRRTKK